MDGWMDGWMDEGAGQGKARGSGSRPYPTPCFATTRQPRYDVSVEGYSAGEFETVFKFVADSGLWGASVRALALTLPYSVLCSQRPIPSCACLPIYLPN
jgi:hypothetical protein